MDAISREQTWIGSDLNVLIELLTVGVIRLDPRRHIVLANAAAHTFLERAPGTLIGMTAISAFLDLRLETLVVEAERSGSGSDEVHLTGTPFTVLARARRAPDGGAWVVLEDVSELRRLQQIRAEFIDNLSHELRTPLTTVSLLAETLGRDVAAAGDAIPAKMRDRIGKVEVETGHLVQMVDELLDLSRIESGRRLVLVDDVDLGRLAVHSADRLRLFAERQGVNLIVYAGEDVRPIRGDAERLGQVFVNLLHNAVKFSPDGGDVTVTVRRDDDRVVASVADHGSGIPKAAQPRLFERFYKVDRARVRGAAGGTGLGLAIARHVIEQHGGTIWVESAVGQGSTFSFAVPIAAAVN
jgi:two-component system phosphate regulon sensor histidine kinase PhoR